MTPQTERSLKEYVDHFGLQIEYVDHLSDNVCGFLQTGLDTAYIIINSRKPRSDQAFTIAHELAHYVMHLDRPPRNLMPWYLDDPWKPKLMVKFSEEVKKLAEHHLNLEWQADLWAFLLLRRIGAIEDLIAITKIYPEKRSMFWYSGVVAIYGGLKRLIISLFRRLFNPFST